jgi:hypothetical protein
MAGARDGFMVDANRARKGKPWIQTSIHLRATAPVLDLTVAQTLAALLFKARFSILNSSPKAPEGRTLCALF